MITELDFPTRIVFGAGAAVQTANVADELGMSAPLLVSDRGLEACGLVGRLESILKDANLHRATFLDVSPNPSDRDVEAGLEAYRAAECDGLIALGGGSVMDAAKGIAVRANHDGQIADYEYTNEDRRPIDQPIPPVIAIPTTAGTGSEVGRGAIITLADIDRKVAVISPDLIPRAAICDPELTFDLPPELTAATGMDAITHAIETFCSPMFDPWMDGVALEALRLARGNLFTAFREGRNVEARSQMMAAAAMGATAFKKGLGAAHALAHPLSAICGVQHGVANTVVLPHVMRFNAETIPKRIGQIARVFDRPPDPEEAIDAVVDLQKRLEMPTTLGETGVEKKHIEPLSSQAARDHCRLTNPRPLSEAEAAALYRIAL
jgi:alcohol dehydrogenase class IV